MTSDRISALVALASTFEGATSVCWQRPLHADWPAYLSILVATDADVFLFADTHGVVTQLIAYEGATWKRAEIIVDGCTVVVAGPHATTCGVCADRAVP